MKQALAVLFTLLAITIFFLNREGKQKAAIRDAAFDYIMPIAVNNGAPASLDLKFDRCFFVSYKTSLLPNGDKVNLDVLFTCLNQNLMVSGLELVKGTENPVPFPITAGDSSEFEVHFSMKPIVDDPDA